MPISTIGSNSLNQTSDLTINGQTVGKGGGNVATNTAVGASALANASNTGANNAAFGSNVLGVNTSGGVNAGFGINSLAANTTGSSNAGFGVASLSANTTGSYNTACGQAALQNNTTASQNTAVGYQAGYTNTLGKNNTFIGYQAKANASNYSNSTALGASAQITASNQIVLGTASETVRYNLLQPLYTSLSTLTDDYVGYVETESNTTIATINTGYQVLMTTQTLPVGIYIYMISQVFQSASTALILETRVRFNISVIRHITIDSVASGGSRTITMTGFLNVSSGTGYMDFSAKTSTGTMTAYQSDDDYTAFRMIRIA